MALPVTGPYVKRFDIPIIGDTRLNYVEYQEKWKQVKPRDRVLPYKKQVSQVYSRKGDMSSASEWAVSGVMDNSVAILAYDKFKDAISDRSQWATNIVEREQALQMITLRCLKIAAALKYLRRGNITRAVDALEISAPPGVKPRKHWADNWLELHFGWVPLVEDIYSGINILQSPIKACNVFGQKRRTYPEEVVPPSGPFARGRGVITSNRVRYGAQVAVTNPNLWLANSLGLLNPASVLWESIPFSFVADWFSNVSQFLESGTDLLGLTLVNSYTTFFNEALVHFYWSGYGWTSDMRQIYHSRSLGISKPSLGLRPFKLFGWKRTATAAALVVQRMR